MSVNSEDVERAKRQKVIDFARASVELSGFKLAPADVERAQRYVDGDVTLIQFVGGKLSRASPNA